MSEIVIDVEIEEPIELAVYAEPEENIAVPGRELSVVYSGNSLPDFQFNVPSNNWVINHNKGKKTVFLAFSNAGFKMNGSINLLSFNTTIISFNEAVSGFAVEL